MPGPPAKHPSARRRRNTKATAATLEAPKHPQGPTLPKTYVVAHTGHGPLEREYDKATRRWWNKIRRSPFAAAYQDAHWEWLLLLAPLFDRWVAFGDIDAFKELRLQAPPFGLRPSDANKMDWVVAPEVVGPASDDDDGAEPPAGRPARRDPRLTVHDGGAAESAG